jgi:chemotaxis response regulator CheB
MPDFPKEQPPTADGTERPEPGVAISEHDGITGRLAQDLLFPVVGIGASAGGLEAFKQFLKALPPDSGMAYVLVQHLTAC